MGQIVGSNYGVRIAAFSRGSEAASGRWIRREAPSLPDLATQNRMFVWAFFEAISGRPKPEELLSRYVSTPAYRQQLALLEAAFPGFELEFEDAVSNGDRLEVQGVFVGTHRGELLGLLATGKTVEQGFRVDYRLEQGKIAQHWLGLNPAELKQHLGARAN